MNYNEEDYQEDFAPPTKQRITTVEDLCTCELRIGDKMVFL
jgi:hypothetical protein